MSYYNSTVYRDAGCPSQCMSENSYSALSSKDECAMNEMGDYTSPFRSSNTPSYCNFNDNYSKIQTMYAPSTIYIPPASAARIYTYPIGVNSDFMVVQPSIVNWKGESEFNNLSSSPIIQDPAALMAQMERDINDIENLAASLMAIRAEMSQLKQGILSTQGQQKIDLAVRGIDLAKQAEMTFNELKRKVSGVSSTSQNVAPYTVRDVNKQASIDALVDRVKNLQRSSQQANIAIASVADILTNVAKPTAMAQSTPEVIKTLTQMPIDASIMSANTDKGIQPFRYLRRRGY